MQSQPANQTIVAVSQLVTYVATIAGVVILAALHVITAQEVGVLAGVGLTHAGIIGYNGATKGNSSGG